VRRAAREPGRILLGEDAAAIAALTREVLEAAGYRVEVSPTHAAALAALAAARYALFLADTEGPIVADADPAHWRSVEAVRAAAPGTPVVIFSAHDPRAFRGSQERGFAGLLSKPFDLDALLRIVGAIVGPR
jgi:CheY-like chemotaxis protein